MSARYLRQNPQQAESRLAAERIIVDPALRARESEDRWVQFTREWQAEIAALAPEDVADGIRRRDLAFERMGRSRLRNEEVTRALGTAAPGLLSIIRSWALEDPEGLHRPVVLRDLGTACLDCRWYAPGGDQDGRAHRALHMNPPAEGLCERHPMPWFFSYPHVPDPHRQVPLVETWPPPAVAVEWDDHGNHEHVCSDCRTSPRS